MLEFIGNLLSGEGNFQNIAAFVGVYLILLWLAFCAWVYADAMKRYDNVFLSVVWFVAVLILNFPALIFYFIVRPDKEDENILVIKDGGVSSTDGGINVPLVNFIGEEGVAISFQLKINKSAIQSDAVSNMKIDVGFDNKDLEALQSTVKEETESLSSEIQNNIEQSETIATQDISNSNNSSISKLKSAAKFTADKLSRLKGKIKFPRRKKDTYEVEVSVQQEEKPDTQVKTPKKKKKKQKYR